MHDIPSSRELDVLRRFKLKMCNKRFGISKLAKFMNEEINDINYTIARKRTKIIIDYELKSGRIVYSDRGKTKLRFPRIELQLPEYVVNKCNTVGTRFKQLYIIKRLSFVTKHLYGCHLCGYNPKYKQMRYSVNTPYGVTKVVICSACNCVITEEV